MTIGSPRSTARDGYDGDAAVSDEFDAHVEGNRLEIDLAEGFVLSRANVDRLWDAVWRAYETQGCRRVLAEGTVVRQMSVADAYVSASTPARMKMYGLRLALVWHDFAPDELSQLFSNAAANRGATVRYFATRRDALDWLHGRHDKACG